MASRQKDEERQRLTAQITEWNANRLDLFELSLPNEDLEFFGVMRFFFQDASSKVATKCIRVASSATTQDVLDTLVEKFRPDMRMLTMPHYSLYEVHANGEERKLADKERPLYVQLNWGKDDREGRFLLKNEDHNKNIPIHADFPDAPGTFKRKLSKREKKELKKKEKEAKLKGKENEKPEQENVAEKLYSDMPDTSFTRTISNPEVVMRRRRQQKLEKKLAEIRSKDDQGGTLKIYGESISPDVPYKTLLLSSQDTAEYVVKETLAKYGLEREDPTDYCLVQVLVPPGSPEVPGGGPNQRFFILDEEDCPLSILMHHPPHEGTVMFQLKKRTPDMPRSRKKKKQRTEKRKEYDQKDPHAIPPERLPFLSEINPDGSEPKKPLRQRLTQDLMAVGSDKSVPMSQYFLKLLAPDIHPHHCVIANSDGIVTITPAKLEAETYVNNRRVTETTVLSNGMVVRFGRMQLFRFIDPMHEEKAKQPQMAPENVQKRPAGPAGPHEPSYDTGYEPDVQMETKESPVSKAEPEDPLPASVEFRDEAEDAFLSASVQRVNGSALQFKLAPTYALYMAVRFRLAKPPLVAPAERAHMANRLVDKTCDIVHQTIQDHKASAGALSFWMANASELLHFYKQDRDIAGLNQDTQDILAESVQDAFHHLVTCLQRELQSVMAAFLDESTEDLAEEDGQMSAYPRGKPNIADVLQVLTNAMSLLRRCRVNAALTIQLFSQLFHFINMWLFNKIVTEPRLGLCTRAWGHRLKRRLGRIEIWAEKQGLELAADCHLARIIQAAHLLEAPKGSPDDILSISSTCFKLNSLQLRALLENYIPSAGEAHIQPELIQRVVSVAQNTADELTRSDGRDVGLEEDTDLQLPFLLPEDGYSCDIVKAVPNGLADFLDTIAHSGICRWFINNQSKGVWTVYMGRGPGDQPENLRANNMGPPAGMEAPPGGMGKEPEVIFVTFNKVNGSMGLSIVAAKGEGQRERGIYVKSVVPGGGAAADGRLQAGDQLLEVDSKNLIGLTQERAAEMMTQTGNRVTLKVAKQGAIYHGLATVLSQQSPIMQRGGPHMNQAASPYGRPEPGKPMGPPQGGPGPAQMKPRPVSEDVSRFGGPKDPTVPDQGGFGGPPGGQRPINMQHAARSSPSLAPGRVPNESFGMQPGMGGPPPAQHIDPYGRGGPGPHDSRSKSVSNLHGPEQSPLDYNRPSQSSGTLSRMHPQGAPGPQMHQGPAVHDANRHMSQPDLRGTRDEANDYENYPGPQGARLGPDPRQQHQADYVNQRDLKNQGSQSMHNLRGDDVNHSRVREWQQRNEMANRSDHWSPTQPAGPGGPGQYHSLQRALDPQSTLRGQKIGPRPPHDPRDPRFNQQQNYPTTSKPQDFHQHGQQNFPHPPNQPGAPQSIRNMPPGHMGGPGLQQQDYPMPPRQGHLSPDAQLNATYQNIPAQNPFPQQTRRPDMQQPRDKLSPMGQPGPMDSRMRTVSPEFPPPPDVPPELPPPPAEDLRNTSHEDLPPPPPQIQAGQDPMRGPHPNQSFSNRFMGSQPPSSPSAYQSNQQNYQNLPPVSSVPMHDRRQEGMYTQAPSQPPPGQQYPRPGSQSQDLAAARTLTSTSRSQSTGSLNRSGANQKQAEPPKGAGGKKPPPIKAKPKLNLAEIKKGFSQSPWEREEKEREKKRREEEMRMQRDADIQDLESKTYLTHEEQERLRRLRLDREFDKRVTEVDNRNTEDDDDDISPTARVKMLRQIQEDIERKRQSAEDDKKRSEMNRQQELEKNERAERRLQQYEQEREAQRQREVRKQEKRAQEQEELLKKQREKEQMREVQLAREAEERLMREREEQQLRRNFERMQMSDSYGGPPAPAQPGPDGYSQVANRAAPAPPERNSSYMYGRAGSSSNLPTSVYNDASQNRQPPTVIASGAKKSVSFDSNLATEIGTRRGKESTGSESSYVNYQVNVGSPEPDSAPAQGAQFQYRGPGGGGDAVNQLFDAPPPGAPYQEGPQYSGSQYPGMPPSSQYQPATSQYQQPPQSQYAPTSQYLPHSQYQPQPPQYQPQSSQYQPPPGQQGRSSQGMQFQNGPQYQGGPPPTSVYQNGPPNSQYQPSYQGGGYQGGTPQSQYQGYPPQHQGVPSSPYNQGPNTNGGFETQQPRTPQGPNTAAPTLVTNVDTPGVVGGQEVYRDPRERMLAQKNQGKNLMVPGSAERLSFRDKMKMFASEAGENTPQDKSKASYAQRRIDVQLKSP